MFYDIIPNYLERTPESKLGNIGILYVNQYVGQTIADAAEIAGYDYVRFDQGNPYPRTPFTTWLEDCAAWCSGGWKTGEPKLSNLIYTWLQFNPSLSGDSEITNSRKLLVSFFFNNREASMPLYEWFGNIRNSNLLDNFKSEAIYVDENETFNSFYEKTCPGELL